MPREIPRKGRRLLRLGSAATAILREQRRRQLAERLAVGRRWQDLDYVFSSPPGTPLDSRSVTKAFQRRLAALGLPRQRFDDHRHAYATMQLEAGADLSEISRALAHSTIGTTADVYAHVTNAMAERSAERLDAILIRPAIG